MKIIRKLWPIWLLTLIALGLALSVQPAAAQPDPTPTPQVDGWKTIVWVDDDSARGVRIYKGTGCTTPPGTAQPIVIQPGYTSAGWWKEPITFRHYGRGTTITRYKISDGTRIDPVIFPPNPSDPNVGKCYPANVNSRLTVGVEYRVFTAYAT